MDVTAATPPGSARGAPDAFRLTEGLESGDTEFPGPGSTAMRFRGLGSAGLLSPDLAPASFPAMIDALRVLQNRIARSAPGEELAAEVCRTLTDLAVQLGPHAVEEQARLAGRLDLPGRGQAMVPVIYLDEQDEQHAAGRVTFGPSTSGATGPRTGAPSPWSSTTSWAGWPTPAGGRRRGPRTCTSATAVSRPSTGNCS